MNMLSKLRPVTVIKDVENNAGALEIGKATHTTTVKDSYLGFGILHCSFWGLG